MFCRNCGTQVPDSAAFCPKCGTQLTAAAPSKPAHGRHSAPSGGSGKGLVLVIVAVIVVLAVLAVAITALSGGTDKDSGKPPAASEDHPVEQDSAGLDNGTVSDEGTDSDTLPDANMDSPAAAVPEPDPATPEPDPGTQELAAAKAAYADVVRELAAVDDSLEFDLINLTGSDIPELLAGKDGYFISVYMWANGEAIPVIEYWPYGAGGNYGYEYLPGQNVIRNYNSDMAGAIVYETYATIDGDYGVIPLWPESLSTWYFRDENGNYMIDEGEPVFDEPIYYYGDTEVTQEQYAAYQVPGDYQWLGGGTSAEEILELLAA